MGTVDDVEAVTMELPLRSSGIGGKKETSSHMSSPIRAFAISNSNNNPQELDAGALFVLKSRGSWLHSGYHLTTSIVGPVLLTLPYSLKLLGWVGGVLCLTLAGLVTFYSYNLLSTVLDHHAQLGHRQLRLRDLASHILGPRWAKYYIGPLQFAVCIGTVIGGPLVIGMSSKAIYTLYNPTGTMKLYQFIMISGIVTLGLAQIPSFHSLRHLNLVSLVLCLAYSACVTVGSIYIGHSKNAPPRSYSVEGKSIDKLFGVFNGILIISTTYACGILPEIQATIAPPVKGKMFKGLCLCYSVIVTNYFSVAISGYWAFGNQTNPTIIGSFVNVGEQKLLVPKWFLLMTHLLVLVQVLGVTVIYMQPTNELFESMFGDPTKGEFSLRNIVPRVISRSLAVIVATVLAAMLPFFQDIIAIFGAFGVIPIDFILPMVFFNLTFKPSKKSLIFWLNTFIALASSVLVVIGGIASIRAIVVDAKNYSLFSG